jgi:hypothetical protein
MIALISALISSNPTALGESVFCTCINQNKSPMEHSPWAFTFFFFPQASSQCHQAHPLRWVGLLCLLLINQNKTHGTQSMGFEDIHQP